MNRFVLLLLSVAALILIVTVVPKDVMYLIGCYQVGSWIGGFVHDKLNEN